MHSLRCCSSNWNLKCFFAFIDNTFCKSYNKAERERGVFVKRLFSLLFALLLALSLVGCVPAPAPAATASTTVTQPTPEPATEPEIVWYEEKTLSVTAEQIDNIINGEFEKPKNIILLIGDGMGPNDIALCSKYGTENFDFGLVLDRIVHHGLATTHSASHKITDSAAAGTALATGTKTANGYVGMLTDGTCLKNISELAREKGKKIGIVTDDSITGATPSAFLVHNESRKNYDEIFTAALDFAPEVYIGKVDFDRYTEANERGYNAASRFQQIEYTFSQTGDRTKPFVGFNSGYSTNVSNELSQCAQMALQLLDNENGFFLMVESCGTDKYGHNNNMKGKISSVTVLDRTLAAILLFIEKNPDTLLIVTSDHETGGVQLPEEGALVSNDLFTTEEHTDTPVRVFAVGQGSEFFHDKTVDNTDIAKFLISLLES